MYWQKRLDREPKDQSLQEKILEIRAEHKDFGYRRMGAAPSNWPSYQQEARSAYRAEAFVAGNVIYAQKSKVQLL